MDYKEKVIALLNSQELSKEQKEMLETIFPELKESEDELHRKWILEYLYDGLRKSDEQFKDQFKCAIAWFEKQGEQKSQGKSALEAAKEEKIDNANKAEPKFKAEDWAVCGQYGAPCQIESIKNGRYYFTNGIGIPVENVNIDYHLWTIQDAKDGDVLAWDDSKCIALFKNIYDEDSFNSYGFVGGCTGTFESRQSYHDIEGAHPATKEQRDLLFSKMKEAGYEWDAGKKELKKIEQKSAEWSEEDERNFDIIYGIIYNSCNAEDASRLIAWLKAIKDRVQPQPKQEWSEEDRIIRNALIKLVEMLYDSSIYELDKNRLLDWLKSLRPQSNWSPSKGQISVLSRSLKYINTISPNYCRVLEELLAQLKKLREE